MTNKKSGTMIAVGLVFGVGGHEIILATNQAESATPKTEFVGSPGQPLQVAASSCEIQPSSGCMTLLPLLDGDLPTSPVGQVGTGYCLQSDNSDGSSGIACLWMGD